LQCEYDTADGLLHSCDWFIGTHLASGKWMPVCFGTQGSYGKNEMKCALGNCSLILGVNNVGSQIGRSIVRYRSIVSWPEDGCIISRNMSPSTK